MADQGSEGFLSPFLRQKRIHAISPYLYGEVLDVGCGSGEFARFVKEDKYLGFDIDEELLFLAKNKFPNHKFTSQLLPKVQNLIQLSVWL